MKTYAQKIKDQQAIALNKLVEFCGSQATLGRLLGATDQTVSGWVKRGRISKKEAINAELLTSSIIKKTDLRPDVFWESN